MISVNNSSDNEVPEEEVDPKSSQVPCAERDTSTQGHYLPEKVKAICRRK